MFSTGWRIGRLFGIDIAIHWTFLLLVAWVGFAGSRGGRGLPGAVEGILFLVALFACIVLHELGHALAARRYGIATRDITLLPIGGVARLERMPEDPSQELAIALAGPVVSAFLALLFGFIALASGAALPQLGLELTRGDFPVRLAIVNGLLLGFNLLPAFPMDGGRVLRAILHYRLDYANATRIAATTGQVFAVLMGAAALFSFNPILLIVAVFLYFGAGAETRLAQVRSACEGVPVSSAMITHFRTLPPDEPISTAIEALLTGDQQDFPIVEDGALLGLVTRADVLRALASDGREAPLRSILRAAEPVGGNETLAAVVERMREEECPTKLVERDGRLVGMVTLENVGEWLMIRSALRGRGRDGGSAPKDPRARA